MHDTASNPPSSSSTTSATCAPAPSTRTRPSWQRSPYEDLSAQQVADQHVAWIKKRRLVFIPTEIAVFAAALAVIALKPPAAGIIYLALLASAVAISFLHRTQAINRFGSLHQICSLECDPAKYRAVMEALVASDVHDRSHSILATEQARGLYYQGESMRALQLLSQVRFKSPKNPYWLAVLSIETMCRHDVGDSAGESLALSRCRAWMSLGAKRRRAAPLPRSSTSCAPAIKSYLRTPRHGRRRTPRSSAMESTARRARWNTPAGFWTNAPGSDFTVTAPAPCRLSRLWTS